MGASGCQWHRVSVVGASLGEWVCDLASRCMRPATLFQRGLSCLCPRVSLASALPASPWPCVEHLGQAVRLGVRAAGIPLLELLCV